MLRMKKIFKHKTVRILPFLAGLSDIVQWHKMIKHVYKQCYQGLYEYRYENMINEQANDLLTSLNTA